MADPASRQYLARRINPILEQLVVALVLNRPYEVIDFMVSWLNSNGKKIEQTIVRSQTQQKYEVESDDDDDYDDIQEKLMDVQTLQILKQDKQMRNSVSSEAYGKYHTKKDYKPKQVQRTLELQLRIKERLNQTFMFQNLEDNDKDIIVRAMEEKSFQPEQSIIKQGEDGEELYVVERGQLDCYKKISQDGLDEKIKTYGPGDLFGELALLYNTPRAATIISKTDVVLYSLDRETFNAIVRGAAMVKRQKYETFLSEIDLLKTLNPYEKLQIADSLKSQSFRKGDQIVKEGDQGELLFILETGQCAAFKYETGKDPLKVFDYDKPGDYFGELVLIKQTTIRQASVIAKTDCTLVYLDKNTFKRLSGNLEQILLQRHPKRYEQVVNI